LATLLVLILAGPAQTLSGKYVPRTPVPLPAALPGTVDALCRLVEAGHEKAPVYAALGDALFARGDKELAYRAFDKAHRLGHDDGVGLVRRKDDCPHVPDERIRAEEREARIWRDALDSFRRSGRSDMGEFYERYGRPEDDLNAIIRARRISITGAACGVVVGFAFALLARRMRRRAAAVPAIVGALCLLGPGGILYWGAGAAFVGAVAVVAMGKSAA